MGKLDELVQLANGAGLEATAAQLARFGSPDAFEDVEAGILDPPAADLSTLLMQITRRGFDPSLAGALLGHFENKPLERGLLAWDVLSQTLWPSDEQEIFGQLQAALREVQGVRPENSGELGLDLNRHPALDLIAQFAARSAHPDLVEGMKHVDLSSIALAQKGNGKASTIARSGELASAVASMGRLLDLAHLPTLSSLYLDFAARGLGHRRSALQLCEAMFDVKAGSRLPDEGVRESDVPPEQLSDLLEYLSYRAEIDAGDRGAALALAKASLERRGELPLSPRLAVVYADLSQAIQEKGPPVALLDRACEEDELWRYAWRVRASHSALFVAESSDSLQPLELCSEFVGRFGNHWRLWYDAFQNTPGAAAWKQDSCAVVGREVMTLPCNAEAWHTLIIQTAPDEETLRACINELENQLDGQVETDL